MKENKKNSKVPNRSIVDWELHQKSNGRTAKLETRILDFEYFFTKHAVTDEDIKIELRYLLLSSGCSKYEIKAIVDKLMTHINEYIKDHRNGMHASEIANWIFEYYRNQDK